MSSSTTTPVSKWNSKVMFPKDIYILRCLEESFGPSNRSGKPMWTLEFEIVAPETINVAGEEYQIVGQKTSKKYVTVKSIDKEGIEDEGKSANLQKMAIAVYVAFGMTAPTEWDNPLGGFKGKLVHALVSDRATEQRKTPTPEQVKRGQEGDVLKHPITGQPLVSHYPEIDEIYGLAEANPGKSF